MTAHAEQLESSVRVGRGDAVVCVPVYEALNDVVQCLRALARHTPQHVPILVADDCTPDPQVRIIVEEVSTGSGRQIAYVRQPVNGGFVRNVNAILDAVAPGDAVIVNSDCVVSEKWFEGLRDAAYSDSRVATVTPLTNSGTIVSVPFRNRPVPSLPQCWSLDAAAAEVRDNSLGLRPTIPTAVGHCMYIKRDALDLVGGLDDAFSPGYEEEVDFSQRCVRMGLKHVVADDVLVLHRGGASFDATTSAAAVRKRHHAIIRSRYPYFDAWAQQEEAEELGPLSRSLTAASRALGGLSVTIDGRILTSYLTGTQLHTLEVVAALARYTKARVRLVVPSDLGEYARPVLSGLATVEILPVDQIHGGIESTDVVHRPYQISAPSDLELLRVLGRRVVITHQDLIAYHNPTYHRNFDGFSRHRRLTRTSLAVADAVTFFSRHAADDAIAQDLIDRSRARVVYLGTDHRLDEIRPVPVKPRLAGKFETRPFLLYLGTDFHHKNRLFALRLLGALRTHQAWDGVLVFAGAKTSAGSSAGDEARFLASNPELEDHVVDLAAVTEAEKAWLLERTVALVYPTTSEGFGLIPFEAAESGKPCLFGHTTSLAELLPPRAALLVPWDPEASAEKVVGVLEPGAERDAHVAILRAASARLTWRRAAEKLMSVYGSAAEAPARPVAQMAFDQAALDAEHADLERAFWDIEEELEPAMDPVDRDLVGPNGTIPVEVRRPLLAIMRRRWLRAVVLFPIVLAYRVGYLARHRRWPSRTRVRPATAVSALETPSSEDEDGT